MRKFFLFLLLLLLISISACQINVPSYNTGNNEESNFDRVVEYFKKNGEKEVVLGNVSYKIVISNYDDYCLFVYLYEDSPSLLRISSTYRTTIDVGWQFLSMHLYWKYGNAGTYNGNIEYQIQGLYSSKIDVRVVADAEAIKATSSSANWKLYNWEIVKGQSTSTLTQRVKNGITADCNIYTPADIRKVIKYFNENNLVFE